MEHIKQISFWKWVFSNCDNKGHHFEEKLEDYVCDIESDDEKGLLTVVVNQCQKCGLILEDE